LLTIESGGGDPQGIIVSDTLASQLQVVISGLTVDGGMTALSGILNRENLTLNDVIATGAQDGITNSGQFSVGAVLMMNNSKLTGNSQSGLFVFGGLEPGAPGGHVTINDSDISDNKVFGILNLGPQHEFALGSKVIVNYSTILGNSAGIINFGGDAMGATGGILEVNNSAVTKNVAVIITEGDGILNIGGGADGATGGVLIVKNSTISNNPGAAIIAEGPQVPGSTGSITQISSSTLSGNKFALIYEPGMPPDVEVKNSIFANSFSLNCAPDVTTLTSLGVNISTDDTCPGFIAVTPDELNLGALSDNGGPTETQALNPPSAAITAVTDCTFINGEPVIVDQRGFLRPEFNCDAGSYEFGARPFVVNVPTLSKWGILLTVLLLFVTVMYFYKRNRKLAK